MVTLPPSSPITLHKLCIHPLKPHQVFQTPPIRTVNNRPNHANPRVPSLAHPPADNSLPAPPPPQSSAPCPRTQSPISSASRVAPAPSSASRSSWPASASVPRHITVGLMPPPAMTPYNPAVLHATSRQPSLIRSTNPRLPAEVRGTSIPTPETPHRRALHRPLWLRQTRL